MSQSILISLSAVLVFGIGAQVAAYRLRLPSILLLLIFGFLAGPVFEVVKPNELFGELLLPLISISVALILFEGGLSLKLSDLPAVGGTVRRLIGFGGLTTWAISAAAARFIFGMDHGLAILLGAVLVVTGPTVIGPLLRHIRPGGSLGPVLMWEGIVIDPIGAILAVLVYEVIAGGGHSAPIMLIRSLAATVVVGGGLGLLAAYALVELIRRYWIPDYLQSAVSLMFVAAAFAGANIVQHESGLLAATIMGVALANQRRIDVKHIVEFKENLRVLLISSLFILLAARLRPDDLREVLWGGIALTAVLVLVARPLAAFLSTSRSGMPFSERMFIAWMAPRGIVAAAVASVFAIKLQNEGYSGADELVPITFIVIIGTVAIYGLTSPWAAYRLGVAEPNPQGLLLIGAYEWVRELAALLQEKGIQVLVVDSNRDNVAAARLAGLRTWFGSVLAEYAVGEMRLGGIGKLLALTPNDWVNTLAVQRFTGVFGRANCFQLPPQNEPEGKQAMHKHLHGRWLFGEGMTSAAMAQRFAEGARIKATVLSDEFNFEAFGAHYGATAVPLMVVSKSGALKIVTASEEISPASGQTLISLALEPKEEASPT